MKEFFKLFLYYLIVVAVAVGCIVLTLGVAATGITLAIVFKNGLWLLILLALFITIPLVVAIIQTFVL